MYANKIRWLLLFTFLLISATQSAYAADWRMTLGGHDFLASGKLVELSERIAMKWFLGLDDRRNTVSSVEKQHKLMPGN